MKARDISEGARVAIVFSGAVALGVFVWVFGSMMEAEAFNRATGKHVSTWDAMWIELRVQEGAR